MVLFQSRVLGWVRIRIIGGERESAIGLKKYERLKTFPGIGNRPVTSRSQESSSARMVVVWLFFIAYVRNLMPFVRIYGAVYTIFRIKCQVLFFLASGLVAVYYGKHDWERKINDNDKWRIN